MVPMSELHVHPHPATGGWTLDSAWFATLGEAEQAARHRAVIEGALVYLHDRYHRVRALVQLYRRTASTTSAALSGARRMSGRVSTSSSPIRMSCPRRTAASSTAHVAGPSPWCSCGALTPASPSAAS